MNTASDIQFQTLANNIRDILNHIVAKNNISLNTNSIQSLSSHLTLAIIRLKSNNYIPLSQGQINSCKKNENYPTAIEISQVLNDQFDVTFPDAEVALLSMYLSKNNLLDIEFNSGFNLLDDEVFVTIQNTIQKIHDQMNIDFNNNDKLQIALGLHLTTAVERLLNDEQIDNPLIDKIKVRFEKELEMANILNDEVEAIYNKRFTEDEIGYFALHFAVALRHNK